MLKNVYRTCSVLQDNVQFLQCVCSVHFHSVYTQPIISKAGADLLRTHFLPTLEKLKKKTVKVVSEEELLKSETRADTQEAELQILDEFAVLCRDLYAFYPMLIRYVDNNRYFVWYCMEGPGVSGILVFNE